MRYFNFLVKRTISRFLQNSALRKTGGSITKVIGGIFGILLTPTAMMIGAGVIGLYIAYTIFGSLGSSMNMTSTSPFSSTYSAMGIDSATSGILGLFPLVILIGVIIAVLVPILGLFRSSSDYGVV